MRDLTSELATLAHDTALAPFLRAGVAVILWSQDGGRVLWASEAAGPVIAAVAPGQVLAEDTPLRRRLKALAEDLAPRRGIRLERLRFGRDLEQTITCACQTIVLPEDGSAALLTAVVGRLPEKLADEAPYLVDDAPVSVAAPEPVADADPAEAYRGADADAAGEPVADEDVAKAPADLAADTARAALADRAAIRPRWRFTWASDADGTLTALSPDLAEALGADAAPAPGTALAGLPGIYADGPDLADAFASGRTFTLRDLRWRTEGGLAARADLSAVAGRDAAGAFSGYRGFGVVHLTDLAVWEPAAPAPAEPVAAQTAMPEAVHDSPPPPPPGPDEEDLGHSHEVDPVDAAQQPAPPSGPPELAPAAHPLAAVTARLREFAGPPGEARVTAGWLDPAAQAEAERERAARRALPPENERDVEAWATDAIARFGETMSSGDRLVAELREHLRREGVETSTEIPEPPAGSAPQPRAEPARPREVLSAADRQTLRDIARALGARELETFDPPAPMPEVRPLPARGPSPAEEPPAPPPAAPVPVAAAADPDRTALALRLAAREAELAEMASILDTATDGVVVVDERGRVLMLNRSAEALFGYDQKEVAGEPFTLLIATESHPLALDYLEGLKSNGVASIMNDGREVLGRVRQGGRIPLFMTMGRIADGPERKFCAVLRDMTAWKKAEGELVEARRAAEKANAHKSDFLATISHEIRTPLNAIIGFAEMMLEERFGPVGNARYKDYLRDIHSSGGHVISLVNDLLDLAKIEAGRMELEFQSVDVNDIVRSCVSLLQGQANRGRVVLRTSLQASLPPVVADERSLRQIALNILSNAVKFTDSGGQVIVSTAITDRGELALRVRDTGIGMTEQDVKAALEPFRQVSTSRRSGGTGLGLPLTRALVEANRGAFAITSRKGEGTLVEILFPPTRVLAN